MTDRGRGYPSAVSFRPETVRGATAAGGHIDYRLARDSVVREFKKGRLSKLDVCDAHPELLRAARNVGRPTSRECPICETAELVLVSYAFGARLPASGRCVTTVKEMTKLKRAPGEVACYVVEVCPDCSWNHLHHTYFVGAKSR